MSSMDEEWVRPRIQKWKSCYSNEANNKRKTLAKRSQWYIFLNIFNLQNIVDVKEKQT